MSPMFGRASAVLTALLLSLVQVAAKTDLSGCVSVASIVANPTGGNAHETVIWYVPDTLEICSLLDCGGGRAPPKSTVPGCPLYQGSETVTPKFLPDPRLPQSTSSEPGATGAPTSASSSAPPTITPAPSGTGSTSAQKSPTTPAVPQSTSAAATTWIGTKLIMEAAIAVVVALAFI